MWTYYSSGQFGFGIQYQIWKYIVQKVGEAFGVGAFINTVGWQMEKNEIEQGFSIKRQNNIPYILSAPAGHLRTLFTVGGGTRKSHHWEDSQSDMGLGRDSYTWYEWTIGSLFWSRYGEVLSQVNSSV
ncbi:GUN4 domain-containing protein [Coleofasciculus sp. FACHB-712]|nr:GUN4 domain-containing protein [Coleofasciculus sp. FACHB-712]